MPRKRRSSGGIYQFGSALRPSKWNPKPKPKLIWLSESEREKGRAWISAHPCPDRPAPPEVHEQYKLGEISASSYRWLCGEDVAEDPMDVSADLF